MEVVADLHVHSKYSRAVSPQMTLDVMAKYARQKGLDLLTASDWTHPVWFKEIRTLLEEESSGIYRLKEDPEGSKFLLSTEISSIYKQGEKLRRIHSLVFAPSFAVVEKINAELVKRNCNLNADGRPIIGLSCKNLLELILSIDEQCMLIPCHAWTPHFGIYGSASGFDSLSEAFGELADKIYAVETGLSSDPDMNWQIPELENRAIVSFSDAHSPAKMGREATVFQLNELTYGAITDAIMRPMRKTTTSFDKNKIIYTLEFYPEEGKYHFSGHRNCKISYGPQEIAEKGTTCPVCHRKMTEGVLLRVQQIAGKSDIETAEKKGNALGLQWFTDPQKKHPPYVKLVPLLEIVAESLHATVHSQKVHDLYDILCRQLTSELYVILKAPLKEIARYANETVAQGVEKVRAGNIVIIPGFDGEYGKVSIWSIDEEKRISSQQTATPQLTLEF